MGRSFSHRHAMLMYSILAGYMDALKNYGHFESTMCFKIEAVGTSHYRSRISKLAQNPVGKRALSFFIAYLVLDDKNRYDSNAVKVVIQGETVAHLSREYAKLYRSYIKDLPKYVEHISVVAAITNGMTTQDGEYEYTIELDIPDSLKIYLSSKPQEDEPVRLFGYANPQPDENGNVEVQVWMPVSDPSELHESLSVEEWTKDSWDTVNYYIDNRQRIGLGIKVYEIPKQEYTRIFGNGPTSAKLTLGKDRFASLRIEPVR